MRGRLHRHAFRFWLNAEIGPGEIGDVGQFGVDQFRRKVGEIQQDIIFAIDAAAGFDLLVNEPGDHVTGRKVLHGRSIARRERFALAVAEDAAFAARRFRKQNAEFIESGGVELIELHVHQRHAAPEGDRDAVAGAGKRVRRDLENAAETARRDHHGFGVENVKLSRFELARHAAATGTVGREDQIDEIVLIEES